ncbi:MAG: hypothetical protein MSH28_05015 [Clostridiales bacterium]|nr:hypothetical protein [Clostridiales bacterium]
MATFAQTFLRIYDRKILSGEITFSQSGINKNDFTRLCVDGEYVIPKERLLVACEKMNLTEEERAELLSFVD